MLSYQNNVEIKEKYVMKTKLHMNHGELISSTFWETELGIPQPLADLLYFFYVNMNFEKSKAYTLLFLESIPVGVNLKEIKNKFLISAFQKTLKNLPNKSCRDIVIAVKSLQELLDTNYQEEVWSKIQISYENAAYIAGV